MPESLEPPRRVLEDLSPKRISGSSSCVCGVQKGAWMTWKCMDNMDMHVSAISSTEMSALEDVFARSVFSA